MSNATKGSLDEETLDDARAYASDVRDLLTGMAALLRLSDAPGALEEIVTAARTRSDALVTALDGCAKADRPRRR